jgi:hypothetical protein
MTEKLKFRNCNDYHSSIEDVIIQLPTTINPYTHVINSILIDPDWMVKLRAIHDIPDRDKREVELLIKLSNLGLAEVPSKCAHIPPIIFKIAVRFQMFRSSLIEFWMHIEEVGAFDSKAKDCLAKLITNQEEMGTLLRLLVNTH